MNSHPISTQALPPNTRLEEFVIERVLGSGGFGITYLARDTSLNRQVVIKENLPVQFAFRDTHSLTVAPRHTSGEDADNFRWSLENFSREAETLASLHHPGIVPVLRRFEAFGTAYFVMPFIDGVPFDHLIETRRENSQPFTEAELHGLLERMLDALDHLHARGIYHRDIKPSNILITTEVTPVLIDFGSARQRIGERSLTVVESPGYTPFEQLESRGNVGPWSDLYALGGTLHKAITGEAPPKAMDRMRRDPRVPLEERTDVDGEFSVEFLRGIDKAMAVEETARWKDAGEWRTSLVGQTGKIGIPISPTVAVAHSLRPQTPVAKTRSLASRGWLWGVAALLILAGFGYAMRHMSQRAEAAKKARADQIAERRSRDKHADPTKAELQALNEALTYLGIDKPPGMLNEDELLVVDAYREAEDKANAEAMVQVGICYANGTGVTTNKERSAKWFRKAAEAGSGDGMAHLGGCYEFGTGVSKNEAEAVKWYSKAADVGDAGAMNSLGVCYAKGTGVAKDEAEAVKWFRKAAEAENARAMRNLGICYGNGIVVGKDEAEAVKWYRKAAEAGDAYAMNSLGECYDSGTGVPKDETEAVKWYRKAVEAGYADAMLDLGRCYQNGKGVPKDEAEAVKWYRKAAEAGDARGMFFLGMCYQNGTGVPKDEAEAVKWFSKVAEVGDAGLMRSLGACYEFGKGVAKDEGEAAKWYRKAAEAGDADAMNSLGVCYDSGTGVPKDEAEAVKWYRKAVEAGYADAMLDLGRCYQNGKGVPKDEGEAVKWYRKAVEVGDARAMDSLGVCYQNGTGVPKDEAEAMKWFRKAAEVGYENAMCNLGLCYVNGTVVAKDGAEAVKWFRKAAETGHENAMFYLGRCYDTGTGVAKDEAQAVKWYRKAAEAGNERAVKRLAELGAPVPNGVAVGADHINEKLRRLVIPRIAFEDITVEEAVDFLRLRSQELDFITTDPAKKGVDFVIKNGGGAGNIGSIKIQSLHLKNIPLGEVLKYVCEIANIRSRVDDFAVVLEPAK